MKANRQLLIESRKQRKLDRVDDILKLIKEKKLPPAPISNKTLVPVKQNLNKIGQKPVFFPAQPEKVPDAFYFQETFTIFLQVFDIDQFTGVTSAVSDIFPIKVTGVRIGNQVTLQFPGISFEIPDTGAPGLAEFVFSINKPIPKVFRPTSAKPIAFTVSAHLTDDPPFEDFPAVSDYELDLYNTGLIQFSLPGGYPISPGQFITEAIGVTYIVSPLPCPLDNFIIATWGPSNATIEQGGNSQFNQFLEYNGLDFQHGRFMTVWADNAKTASGTIIHPTNVAFARFDFKKNKLTQKIGPEYVGPDSNAWFAEYSLSISQTDPNLVAFIGLERPTPRPPTINLGDFYGLSTDGGNTFTTQIIFPEGGNVPPVFGADTILGWDRFNNLFAAYLSADPVNRFPFTAAIVGSPRGDPNKFRLIQLLTITIPSTFGLDYPWLATGPSNNEVGSIDGGRPEAVWTVVDQVGDVPPFLQPNLVYGFQVNGPLPDDPNAPLDGIITNRRQYEVEIGVVGGLCSIAVGPKGDVMISSISNGSLFSGLLGLYYQTLFASYNPLGLNGDFSPRRDIAIASLGILASVGPQPIRDTAPFPRLVADRSKSPFNGRFYCVYVDTKVKHSGNGFDIPADGQIIMLTWSDNGGVSWADPIQVNNDPKNPNSHFEASIALDQSTGNVAVAWYDARLDPGNGKCDDQDNVRNTDVRWTGSIITVEYIKELEKQRKCPKELKLKD